MFAFADRRGAVEVAFTDRAGGVSGGAFASLNLAAAGGDDITAVQENLRRVVSAFAGSADAPVAAMHQVHGADVAVVGGGAVTGAVTGPVVGAVAGPVRAGTAGLPQVDGLATAQRGVTLLVRVADCLPVLVADVEVGVVGALHVGRRGLVQGIVPRGLAVIRQLGGERLFAWLGPRVCGGCYEVPASLRAEVAEAVPEAWAETRRGTPAVDVAAGAAAQLRAHCVEVLDVGTCTCEDPACYSYRRDGERAGRLAGLVMVHQ